MAERETEKIALVLVDHGSRNADANAVVERTARDLAQQTGERFVAVEAAHMELASPSLAEAFDAAVASGAGLVIVVLFFLGPGRHSQRDIPALVERGAERHPRVRFVISDPLGPDQRLVDLALLRAGETISRRTPAPSR